MLTQFANIYDLQLCIIWMYIVYIIYEFWYTYIHFFTHIHYLTCNSRQPNIRMYKNLFCDT